MVGGGHAGLCAAITAREAGARVLLLEKGERAMRAGNTRHTRNLRVAHPHPVDVLAGEYSSDEFLQDLLKVTGGNTNLSLAAITVEDSFELYQWLRARGVHFQKPLSGTLNLSRTNAFFLGGGCALANSLYTHAEDIGVDIRYQADVERLLWQDNVVVAVGLSSGEVIPVGAVVAAAGGFQANLDWLAESWGDAARNFLVRGTPLNTGDLLSDLLDEGCEAQGDPSQFHAVAIDARAPAFDGGIVSRLDCVPFGIVVNKLGERFYDEGEDFWPKRYAIWGRLVAAQPEQIAYAIVDAQARGCFMPSLFPPIQAQTLPELAEQLDLPADALVATVEAFNRATRERTFNPDELDDCATEGLAINKSHWARPLRAPPYAAYPLRPGITFTYLGVRVNERGQVLKNGVVCANVFAAGEIMAGNVLGEGYCAGTGMTIGGVFGRIAGAHASAWVGDERR